MARFSEAAESAAFPLVAVALTIVTWGLVSPLIKLASISGPALAFYRLWIGALLLIVLMARSKQPVTASAVRWSIAAGLLFGANMLAFVLGVKLTTVANATLIGALQPAIVLLVAGRLFGEIVTTRQALCVVGAIAGVAVVIVGSAGAPEWNPAGDAMATLAVLTFTAYFLISKQARTSLGTLEYMTGVHLVAAIVVTPVALSNPGELIELGIRDALIVGFFALVSGTLGQVVISWAHRYVDVTVSSLMMLGVPVVASAAAWLMLDEALGPVQIIGAAVTLVAIAAMLRRPGGRPAVEWEAVPPAAIAEP